MNVLIDMSRPKPDKTDEPKPITTDEYYEKYPWGLRVSLRNDEIQKLGIDTGNFSVGDTLELCAKVTVVQISSEQRMASNGDKVEKPRQDMDLQITAMSLMSDNDFEGAFKEAVEDD